MAHFEPDVRALRQCVGCLPRRCGRRTRGYGRGGQGVRQGHRYDREGRFVRAVRVGPLAARASSNKVPTVYLVGTHHANEWLGEEVTLQLARWYRDSVTGAGGDPSLVALLQSVAVVFVPVVNPDGYQFTHTQDPNTGYRDHRANKRQTVCNNPFVDGIDLNRNYAYGWGSEADPAVPQCHGQTYPGGAPASEPETLGMQRLLAGQAFTSGTTGQDIQQPAASVSLHSYGNVVLYPPSISWCCRW